MYARYEYVEYLSSHFFSFLASSCAALLKCQERELDPSTEPYPTTTPGRLPSTGNSTPDLRTTLARSVQQKCKLVEKRMSMETGFASSVVTLITRCTTTTSVLKRSGTSP